MSTMNLSITINIEHKLFVSPTYCANLCRRVVDALLIADADLKKSRIFIRNAKGCKDWCSLLLAHLRNLFKQYL